MWHTLAIAMAVNSIDVNLQAFIDSTPQQLQRVVSTNMTGTLLCTRAAMQVMQKQQGGGHIFNMDGAGADGMPTPQYAAYGATKAGVLGHMLHWVFVNALHLMHKPACCCACKGKNPALEYIQAHSGKIKQAPESMPLPVFCVFSSLRKHLLPKARCFACPKTLLVGIKTVQWASAYLPCHCTHACSMSSTPPGTQPALQEQQTNPHCAQLQAESCLSCRYCTPDAKLEGRSCCQVCWRSHTVPWHGADRLASGRRNYREQADLQHPL